MTYKDTLFFIGQCLTINHEEDNKQLIEEKLKTNKIDWEAVVKISTGHYVFPALYCNLKRAGFLHYLPEDLVDYMAHITDLNRERNQQIIEQAKEINELLLANQITPIFIKGTGNLLEGLYEDIAERMVGDIDFIVSKEEYLKTIEVITNFGYVTVIKDNYQYPIFKHYPRLQKNSKKCIAAVEIHKELLIEKHTDEFNYELIKRDIQHIISIHVMSFKNQLNLSVIATQVNDNGFDFKSISLRNAYDVFLLSQKTNAKDAIANFTKLFEPLNSFLAVSHEVFGKITSLEYDKTKNTISYLKIFYKQLNDNNLREKYFKRISRKLFFTSRLEFIIKSFTRKEYRTYILKRAMDKKWQRQKLVQLGFKDKGKIL